MDRKKELINLLLEAKKPLTTTELSTRLQVSSRTIRNDLDEIEGQVQAHCCRLVKKPRVGISIEGSSQNKDRLYLDVSEKGSGEQESYSKESRRNYILTRLLLGKSRMYISHAADMFYTSKSTIEKDLIAITQWLQQHRLELKRQDNQGLYVTGSEIDIRNAFALVVSSMQESRGSLDQAIEEVIDIDIRRIQKQLARWAEAWKLELGETNIKNLAFHIAIMISRIRQNKTIQMREPLHKQIVLLKQQDMIQGLIHQMAAMTDVALPDEEINYILLHLIGMTLDNNILLADDEIMLRLRRQAEDITDEFITNLEQIVSLGLPNNLSLRESLILHLLPTVYRLKYGLNLYNPLLHEIKENYASAYALASIINSSFKKKLGVMAADEEIAFIALHISLALENSKEKPTIAVVCPMGRGISRFLLIRLEENFPQVNFLNYAAKDILSRSLQHVDMVMSTIPLNIEKPCITISAIVSDEDIRMIKTMLRNFENKNRKYFSLQTVLLEHEECTKSDVLKLLSKRLESCNYVDDTFLNGVLEREHMGSTEIGNGIVLTHGFHESVKRSQIAFCKLDHPVLWNTQAVSFVVMMAIEKNDAKNVMQMDWLYKTLNNPAAMKSIMESQNESELFHKLNEEYGKY